jgi:hypothetical protein
MFYHNPCQSQRLPDREKLPSIYLVSDNISDSFRIEVLCPAHLILITPHTVATMQREQQRPTFGLNEDILDEAIQVSNLSLGINQTSGKMA